MHMSAKFKSRAKKYADVSTLSVLCFRLHQLSVTRILFILNFAYAIEKEENYYLQSICFDDYATETIVGNNPSTEKEGLGIKSTPT